MCVCVCVCIDRCASGCHGCPDWWLWSQSPSGPVGPWLRPPALPWPSLQAAHPPASLITLLATFQLTPPTAPVGRRGSASMSMSAGGLSAPAAPLTAPDWLQPPPHPLSPHFPADRQLLEAGRCVSAPGRPDLRCPSDFEAKSAQLGERPAGLFDVAKLKLATKMKLSVVWICEPAAVCDARVTTPSGRCWLRPL